MRQILEKWINQEGKSDNYGFESNVVGLKFGDHPFKIKEISCSAPVVAAESMGLMENEFDLVVSISPGAVCDLSKYEKNIKIPLYVAKKGNRYDVIKAQAKEVLTQSEIDDISIPVTLHNPYTLKIKTVGRNTRTDEGQGMLFLVVSFQELSTTEENEASEVISAEILTTEQLKDKFPSVLFSPLGARFPADVSNQNRVITFYTPYESYYIPADEPSKADYPNATPELVKKINTSDVNYYVFQPRPSPPNLKNNLFLRIY